jgi:hypothetical protein
MVTVVAVTMVAVMMVVVVSKRRLDLLHRLHGMGDAHRLNLRHCGNRKQCSHCQAQPTCHLPDRAHHTTLYAVPRFGNLMDKI